MRIRRQSLPNFLAKPINPANAPARGLRQLFCIPPDNSDEEAYVREEVIRRVKMLDQECGLDGNASDLCERRVKAIVHLLFGIPADTPDWWARLCSTLMVEFVPGFTVSKRGRPRIWRFADYIDLNADVTSTKKCYPDLRGEKLYEAVQRRKPRWARYGIPALRRAHVEAKARIRSLFGASVMRAT